MEVKTCGIVWCYRRIIGAGKTLTLAFLAWHNWLNKGRKVFANFNLYGFPFTKVTSIPSIEEMQSGFFAADEKECIAVHFS
jgi:hypothetical protein